MIAPSHLTSQIPRHHSLIVAQDYDSAVWRLVLWQRRQLQARVIGVTGSCGKTTTKEMIASILAQKYRVFKSSANNNIIQTIPNHLFQINRSHQAVVLEMGMANLGNIRMQCFYAKPSIGVVTNVGEAHVGSLGNSLKNVVRAKQELVNGIHPRNGVLILNADDPGTKRLSLSRFRGRIIRFGIRSPSDVQATQIQFLKRGMIFRVANTFYKIPVWGVHNIYNALAAIAVGRQMGIPYPLIKRGLQKYKPPSMRLQPLYGVKGFTLINDTYNANPASMIAGLKVLKQVAAKGHSVAVLGDMNELGKYSRSGHYKVGRVVTQLGISRLITIGPQSVMIAQGAIASGMPQKQIHTFQSHKRAYQYILQQVTPGSTLLFKASRNMRLDSLVRKLCL